MLSFELTTGDVEFVRPSVEAVEVFTLADRSAVSKAWLLTRLR